MESAKTLSDFKGATMKYALVQNTYLVFHGLTGPLKDEWTEYVGDVERDFASVRGIFVFTAGAAPDSIQRRQVTTMCARQSHAPKIAVVFTDPVVDVAVTALNYFMPNPIRTFRPDEITLALEQFLALNPRELGIVRGILPSGLSWARRQPQGAGRPYRGGTRAPFNSPLPRHAVKVQESGIRSVRRDLESGRPRGAARTVEGGVGRLR